MPQAPQPQNPASRAQLVAQLRELEEKLQDVQGRLLAMGSGANAPAPGKIPLSSMAPTLVLDGEGEVWLAVGSPGGTTIPTTVAQVISHLVDDGMSLSQSVSTPRLHHQWQPDAIQVEPGGLEAETARALEALGHRLLRRPRSWGNAQAVRVTPEGWREAASDASGEGKPAVP